MRARSPDLTSLVAGIVVALMGVLLLLHDSGTLDLTFAAFAPLACAVTGAILVAAGLNQRD
jgi:hypothetical protein